jgi:hypothetical protein
MVWKSCWTAANISEPGFRTRTMSLLVFKKIDDIPVNTFPHLDKSEPARGVPRKTIPLAASSSAFRCDSTVFRHIKRA